MYTINLQPMSLIFLDFIASPRSGVGMDGQIRNLQVHFSSTQRAAVSEQLVSSQLMLKSEGRLSPYAPVADDDGVDFLIKDKLTRHVVELQVKAAFVSEECRTGTAQFDIRIQTFNEMSGGYVLAVMIDPDRGIFWRGWMIPAAELPGVSQVARGCYIIRPNPSSDSRDRYSQWQVQSMHQVANCLMRSKALEDEQTGIAPCADSRQLRSRL